MSVLDDLKSLESRVRSRLEELRPLVEEYQELEHAAARLGVVNDTKAERGSADPATEVGRPTTAPKRPGSVPRKPAGASRSAARRRTRARGSSRRSDQVLAVVKANPGATVKRVGAELEVDPTSLYRIVKRLESEGKLKKDGRELTLV